MESRTLSGLPLEVLRSMAMTRVARGARQRFFSSLRRNPKFSQLDALNELLRDYYAGDRRGVIQDRIANLFYLFLEIPAASTRMTGIDMEDVKQEVMAKLWDRLVSGALKKDLPIRGKGYFGLMFRNQAIDENRKRKLASLEGVPEMASTGISLERIGLTEEQMVSAVKEAAELGPAEASGMGAATTYLKRWYGRRPDIVVARELEVTPDNLRVRAHRAGVTIYSGNRKKGKNVQRKIPELRRDAMGDLAVPVTMPRKPPDARVEWMRRWYPVLTRTELVALTGYRSWPLVRAAARRLKIADKSPDRAPLNRVGMEWVALVYPYLSTKDMALDLGVPEAIVEVALRHLDVNPHGRDLQRGAPSTTAS